MWKTTTDVSFAHTSFSLDFELIYSVKTNAKNCCKILIKNPLLELLNFKRTQVGRGTVCVSPVAQVATSISRVFNVSNYVYYQSLYKDIFSTILHLSTYNDSIELSSVYLTWAKAMVLSSRSYLT